MKKKTKVIITIAVICILLFAFFIWNNMILSWE